jgi:hypothetical protein
MMNRCLFFVLAASFYVCAAADETKPVKYAPAYCTSLKFNCMASAKHVCCKWPHPPAGENGAGVDGAPNARVRGAGLVRIRPIRLPAADESGGEQKDASAEKEHTDNNQPKGSPVVRQRHQSSLLNRRKPVSGQPPPTQHKPKEATSQNKDNNSSSFKRPVTAKTKPRICLRLVVNCNNSPDHRCCQFEDEPKQEHEQEEQKEMEEGVAKEPEVIPEEHQVEDIQEHEEEKPMHENVEDLAKEPEMINEELQVEDIQDYDEEKHMMPTPRPVRTTTAAAAKRTTVKRKRTTTVTATTDTTLAQTLSTVDSTLPEPRQPPPHPQPVMDDEQQFENFPDAVYTDEAFVAMPTRRNTEVHRRIPAECFDTETYDCNADSEHVCCEYMK